MQQESTENWIDHMINKAFENYNGREIVIWGRYGVSDSIKDGLREKYGIDTAFYVDSDISKINGRTVLSPEYLFGKSDKYFIIIPIAFYQSVKDAITGGGYSSGLDYYYFCDCVLRQELEYYEDLHGNKIVGNYQGLKFVFSGFHSVIEIEENVQFQKTVFYIHNDAKIVIRKGAQFQETVLCVHNDAKIRIGENARFSGNEIYMYHSSKAIFGNETYINKNNINIAGMAKLNIKNECNIGNVSISIGKHGRMLLEEKVVVCSNDDRKTWWIIGDNANFYVGERGRFGGQAGECFVWDNAILKIGVEFSINGNYRITADLGTSILIGDDCMFSYDISMRSNDGHSIFDVVSKDNINSTDDVNRSRSIVIGNHVWIGERAYILYNTQIGDGSIIGAMSLVKGRIPNNCIMAGIPAKVIKRNIAWSREYGVNDIIKCGQKYIHYTKES